MTEKFDLTNADRVGKIYLINALVENKGYTRADATEAVDGILDAIVDALRSGVRVSLSNIGTLRPHTTPEAVRRNPATGQSFVAPPRNTIRWSPSVTLQAVLNGEADRDSLSRKAPKSS